MIKLQARRRRMMSVTAGLLVLNLGLLAQALAMVPQHAGRGDETAAPQVEVTKKKISLASLQIFKNIHRKEIHMLAQSSYIILFHEYHQENCLAFLKRLSDENFFFNYIPSFSCYIQNSVAIPSTISFNFHIFIKQKISPCVYTTFFCKTYLISIDKQKTPH